MIRAPRRRTLGLLASGLERRYALIMTMTPLSAAPSANGAASLSIPAGDELLQAAPAETMTTAGAPPAASAEPSPTAAEPAVALAPREVELTAASYARLVLGGLLEVASFLQQQLQQSAAGTGAASGSDGKEAVDPEEVRLAAETIELVKEAFATAGVMGLAAASTGQKMARPVYRSRLFAPLRGLAGHLAQQTAEIRARVMAVGRSEAERSRKVARDFFEHTVREVTDYLGRNQAVDELVQRKVGDVIPTLAGVPAIDALIQDLVGRYIAFLEQHPAQVEALVQDIADGYIAYLGEHPDLVDALIRQRGDRYLDYLHDENPEAVQELIQGQSLGLAGEVMDQVRERTVTADSLLEAMVRAVLRRTPRENMPEPPDEIKQQAIPIRLPYRRPDIGSSGKT